MTQTQGVRGSIPPGLGWGALHAVAVCLLAYGTWAALTGTSAVPIGSTLALGVGAVAARLLDRRPGILRGAHLVFVGAAAISLDLGPAVWVAAVGGLGTLFWRSSTAGFRQATLQVILAAAVHLATGLSLPLEPDRVIDGPARLGDAVPQLTFTGVLAAGVAFVLLVPALRGLAGLVDRRATVRGRLDWDRNLLLGVGAVITAALWVAVPALLPLLVAGVVLVARRDQLGVTPGRTPWIEHGPASLRVAMLDELTRAEQFDRSVAVLFVAIDGLAALRARLGDTGIDEVATAVGLRTVGAVREHDVVARVAPAAFVVVLPDADRQAGQLIGERVRRAVGDAPVIAAGGEEDLTVSVGVAAYPHDFDHPERLVGAAELAAHVAGAQGGDRVQDPSHVPGDAPSRLRRSRLPGEVETRSPLEGSGLVRALPEPLAGAHPGGDRLLAGVAVLAVVCVALAMLLGPLSVDVADVLVFALLAVAAEAFAEPVTGRASVSVAAVPLIALAVLPGSSPVDVVLATLATGLLGGLARGLRARQSVYNSAVLVLSGLAALWAVRLLGRPQDLEAASDPLVLAALGLVGGAAFFLLDTGFVALGIAVSDDLDVTEALRHDLAWVVPHQVGMALLAGAMAFAHAGWGVGGAVLLATPAAGLSLAQRRFLRRTREQVGHLRGLTQDVESTNRRVTHVNERLSDVLEQVNHGYLGTIDALAAVVDRRDGYDDSRSLRVEGYARRLVEILDRDVPIDDALLWGFRLHDIGKIGVPDRVLRKPGELDEMEWELMRAHPEIGARLIASAPFLAGAREIVLHHHERWDGDGYPYGLAARAIPFGARVFAVVDAYDAMTSDRPHRRALEVEQAVHELVRNQGTQFDPEIVEAFLQIPQDQLDRIRRSAADKGAQRPGRASLSAMGRYVDLTEHRPAGA